MKGALGLKKGSVPFKNDLETTLTLCTEDILCIPKCTYTSTSETLVQMYVFEQ